jgi:hypothetical protein
MGVRELPVRVIRYGRDAPLPERRELRAGPLTATLEDGALRYVRLGGHEVVRAVYAAVRDHNWGTVESRFLEYSVDAGDQDFRVRFSAEHRHGAIDFVWQGTIVGSRDGVITFTLDGEARSTFLRNRIGFCVLHPMELAGTPLEVETASGTMAAAFPAHIAADRPLSDIVAIRQAAPSGGRLEVRFAGDLFEMEDQRNWTDASFKTYCTPHRLPFPVLVPAGTRVQQAVTVRVLQPPAGGTAAAAPADTISTSTSADSVVDVAVAAAAARPLPPIGIGAASHGRPLSEREAALLRRLHPAHLRVVLELAGPRWREALVSAAADAAALGAALELEIVAGDAGESLDHLAAALTAGAGGAGLPPLARILVFPESGAVTTARVLSRAREVLRRAGIGAPLGGGTRADFVNLNEAGLPFDLMDVVGYAINPQVHAFDNASLVETLAAQAATVENARRLAGGDGPGRPKEIAIGPVTLRQRINAAATAAEAPPAAGELPLRVDPRQMSLFGAGWTAGSLRRLAEAGATSLTYFETTGWLGVMERTAGWAAHPRFHSWPGMIFPVYHVLADVGSFAARAARDGVQVEVLPVAVSRPLEVEALAVRAGNRVQLHVANLVDAETRVRVTRAALAPLSKSRLRVLDETTAAEAVADAPAFRQRADSVRETGSGEFELHLRPFAVACLRGDAVPT